MERLSTTLRNLLRLRDAQYEISLSRGPQLHEVPARGHATNSHNGSAAFSLINEDGNIRRMEQIEAEAIRFAMQYYKGRMTEVARRLGIGRSTLYRKLNELNVRQQEAA
jgi:DNA-binding NtrC family response regulator